MAVSRDTIIVGLSGGVDSAVAALLLVEQGYDVQGLFMKNWEDDDSDTECSAEADFADARQVADTLGIPLHRVNFAREYRQQVFEACLAEFRAGRTPNPDILCNRHIKFRAFLDHARRLGATRIATGHYAGVGGRPGARTLLRAADGNKDQTYFLHALDQAQLEAAVFPLAGLCKDEVRRRADAAGFANFDKPDSTGICFIGERDFAGFLGRYLPREPGPIVDTDGSVLGEHRGLAFYTVGQRRGLELGGRAERSGAPWYVLDKDLSGNRLIVVQGHDHPALFAGALEAGDVHWISGAPPRAPLDALARVRHRQPLQPCRVVPRGGDRAQVIFRQAQRALAPGQSVVFYDDSRCLGGGVIERRLETAARESDLGVA